jgi:hypothetical protein
VWVWRLRKARARLVLAGLRFADGKEATDENCIYTSGVHFRDEIVRLTLHAGYAVRFSVNYKAGDHRGYDKLTNKPIIATDALWAVSYSDNPLAAEPVLYNQRDIDTVDVSSGVPVPVWCVTVPPHHLIITRRVGKNAKGDVTHASKPIVVGNCRKDISSVIRIKVPCIHHTAFRPTPISTSPHTHLPSSPCPCACDSVLNAPTSTSASSASAPVCKSVLTSVLTPTV